jgi:hypothetical protein
MQVCVYIAIELYCIRDMVIFFYKKKSSRASRARALAPSFLLRTHSKSSITGALRSLSIGASRPHSSNGCPKYNRRLIFEDEALGSVPVEVEEGR